MSRDGISKTKGTTRVQLTLAVVAGYAVGKFNDHGATNTDAAAVSIAFKSAPLGGHFVRLISAIRHRLDIHAVPRIVYQ